LYAGTWPEYNETELGFDTGKAILAKASMSFDQFRAGFDISLPLFHPSHPEKGEELGSALSNEFPTIKKHLIAFKGILQFFTEKM
jgi:glucuronyl/N-acetylglucosaminyl transferase EXT1